MWLENIIKIKAVNWNHNQKLVCFSDFHYKNNKKLTKDTEKS